MEFEILQFDLKFYISTAKSGQKVKDDQATTEVLIFKSEKEKFMGYDLSVGVILYTYYIYVVNIYFKSHPSYDKKIK